MSQLLSRLKKNSNEDINTSMDVDDISIDTFAEDNAAKKKEKKEKGTKKRGWLKFLIIGVVLAALAGFGVAVIQFNALGLRDNYLRDILESVPVVNNLLPPLEAYEPVAIRSVDELLLEISRLETQSENLNSEILRLEGLNSNLLNQVVVLEEFERTQVEFSAAREVFERESALGNPAAYEAFFREISPERAEEIFREIAGINHHSAELRSFISTYINMDESAAADIFEQLIRTDSELLITILRGMSAQQRADILAQMTVRSAEQLTRWMAPEAPETP